MLAIRSLSPKTYYEPEETHENPQEKQEKPRIPKNTQEKPRKIPYKENN